MRKIRLERRLFPAPPPPPSGTSRPLPAWSEYQELRRKGVTLALLWREYKATHPEGLQCSRFWEGVPGLGGEARRRDAPSAPRRRADVRRLRRPDRAGRRAGDRRAASGAGLRGRARRVELHGRRGDVNAGPAGLDGVAPARLRVLRRVSRAGRPPTTCARPSAAPIATSLT